MKISTDCSRSTIWRYSGSVKCLGKPTMFVIQYIKIKTKKIKSLIWPLLRYKRFDCSFKKPVQISLVYEIYFELDPLPIVHYGCHGSPLFTWYHNLKKWNIVIFLTILKVWSPKLAQGSYLGCIGQVYKFFTKISHYYVIWFKTNQLRIVNFAQNF